MFEKSSFASIAAAVALHAVLLFFAVFTVRTAINQTEEHSAVMKLVDVWEQETRPILDQITVPNTSDAPAETVIETDEDLPVLSEKNAGTAGEFIDFLPMHKVSVLPRFDDDEIKKRTVYPPIAQRAGQEGTVYLEIFVDSHGLVRTISILKEDPPGRGFGEAAVKVFQGLRGSPALSNGEAVAVRYRYPVRFQLK
jgi:protein TonB